MNHFIISARKYRPSTFSSVVGQNHIVNTLKNSIKNKQLAQSFLFCGPKGVGKTTCARILAKTINCENINENTEPCNSCHSCKDFMNNSSLNIIEIDAASHNSVEDIRNVVQQIRYPPHKYNNHVVTKKIYLIDEAHMLSNQAFNAFLKTLEEPPSYAIFILITTEKHKIIPTILSRCQIFEFHRMQISEIVSQLKIIAHKEKVEAEEKALHLIAQKAEGAMRDALSLYDMIVNFSSEKKLNYQIAIDNLQILDQDIYFQILDLIIEQNTSKVLLKLNEVIEKGFELQPFVIGMSEHIRNILLCKTSSTVILLECFETTRKKYQKEAKKFSTDFLIKCLDMTHSFEINFKNTKNQRVHIELLLFKILSLTKDIHQKREKETKDKDVIQKNIANHTQTDTQIEDIKKEEESLKHKNTDIEKTSNNLDIPSPKNYREQLKKLEQNKNTRDISIEVENKKPEVAKTLEDKEGERDYFKKNFSLFSTIEKKMDLKPHKK